MPTELGVVVTGAEAMVVEVCVFGTIDEVLISGATVLLDDGGVLVEGDALSFVGGVLGSGDVMTSSVHGEIEYCHKRNGRVSPSQMPHVCVVDVASVQPLTMFHPATSKKECVFIETAVTSESSGWTADGSFNNPMGFNPVTPGIPASQYDEATEGRSANPNKAPDLGLPAT